MVLLNSDTEVYGDWLDRLIAQARRPNIATATPFSNNATICSYPKFNADNPLPLELEYRDLDALAAKHNAGEALDLVTGVGFCMLVTRKALNQVGYFDEKMFGRGYGEENDFCMRAQKLGFQNVMTLDVFVRHTGETSFGIDANAAQQQGITTVQRLHPEYVELVHKYIQNDPARSARQKLDCARLRENIGGDTAVLCLTHNWGGGIKRHLSDRARAMRSRKVGLLTLSPMKEIAGTDIQLELNCIAELLLPNLIFPYRDFPDSAELTRVLRHFNITSIEIHSLVGWPPETFARISCLAKILAVEYQIILHDYVAVCPQINLINETNIYCGEKGINQCRTCLQDARTAAQVHGLGAFQVAAAGTDILQWRRAYYALLKGAKEIRAPSADTTSRYLRYFPDLMIQNCTTCRGFHPAY